MRFLRITFYCLTAFLLQNSLHAQTQNGNLQEPQAVRNLLEEKRKINAVNTTNDKYKIQIFYGSNNEAVKKLADFKRRFNTIDGTIIYTNPSYKVWVGNYQTRIEAERNLRLIQKQFENALLINPGK